MLVKIVKNWSYPSNFFRQTPGNLGEWDGIKFTEEPVDECDFLIVLQNPNEDIKSKCPIGNKWLISQEPPVKGYKFCTKSYKHFDQVYTYYQHSHRISTQTLQPLLPWHVNRSYDELLKIQQNELSKKKNRVTWITSNKRWFPGHKKRLLFKDYLLNTSIDFNLFGKGFKPVEDKFDELFPSKYALAVENCQQRDYWTEKLADCYLSWCLPFYWGAENVEEYFPVKSFIRIDLNDLEFSVSVIQDAIRNNEWEKRLDAIGEARNLVLNQYQFFPYVAQMIRKRNYDSNNLRKERFFIPANPIPKYRRIARQLLYYSSKIARIR